jgi:hypothetical protein
MPEDPSCSVAHTISGPFLETKRIESAVSMLRVTNSLELGLITQMRERAAVRLAHGLAPERMQVPKIGFVLPKIETG